MLAVGSQATLILCPEQSAVSVGLHSWLRKGNPLPKCTSFQSTGGPDQSNAREGQQSSIMGSFRHD